MRIGSWRGLPNYECLHCPHSTLEEEEAKAHYEQHFPPAPVPESKVSELLVDATGNPLEIKEG